MNELQAQLQEVTDQLAQLDPNNRDNLVEIAGLKARQAELLEAISQEEQQAAQMVRIQAQEEKVESIVLPYDFDEIFDNKNANEMIIELVKEFQRKAYEDHNAEIQTLTDAHKEDQRASQDRETQLKRQNDELQNTVEGLAAANEKMTQEAGQLILDKEDADSKRDAAVKQLEEAQAEIAQLKSWNEDLRAQAAQGVRKAIDVIDISPSEKLAQMVKETNEQKANRALSRWAEMMPEVVAPPIAPEVSTFQPGDTQTDIPTDQLDETGFIPIPADHTEVAPITFPVSSGDAMDSGASATDGQGALEERVAKLEATVKELCEVCNIAEVA